MTNPFEFDPEDDVMDGVPLDDSQGFWISPQDLRDYELPVTVFGIPGWDDPNE
jgi:hypothetical protein